MCAVCGCGLTSDVRCAIPDTCVEQCLAEYITTRTHLTVFNTNSLPGSKLADLHTRRVSCECLFFAFCLLVHAPADSSMRRRTPPDLAPRGRARSAPPTPAARTPASCAATGASGERQPGFRQGTCASRCARGAAHRGSRRIAPAATRHARGRSARRPPPSLAADHAAALWQLWCRVGRTTDDDHLPGGRVTRALPPPAKGHGRGAWCKRRNRTAGGRWGQHLPGQPALRLHPHALVRAAFDNAGSDRHGLWVRHADTHAQSNRNTRGARESGRPCMHSRISAPAPACPFPRPRARPPRFRRAYLFHAIYVLSLAHSIESTTSLCV